MFDKLLLIVSLVVAAVPQVAHAEIVVEDAYARVATPLAKTGAVFLVLRNDGDADDRLLDVASDAAMRVELHAHIGQGNGVMQMVHAEDGFAIPAGGDHALLRGGDHVMFMGLARPWRQGDLIPLTLIFENAGEMTLEIPVDLER